LKYFLVVVTEKPPNLVRPWETPSRGKLEVVTPEEMELSRLRAENLRLKRELEIIKKAAAYFAKDVL
jgi:transposase-like protein